MGSFVWSMRVLGVLLVVATCVRATSPTTAAEGAAPSSRLSPTRSASPSRQTTNAGGGKGGPSSPVSSAPPPTHDTGAVATGDKVAVAAAGGGGKGEQKPPVADPTVEGQCDAFAPECLFVTSTHPTQLFRAAEFNADAQALTLRSLDGRTQHKVACADKTFTPKLRQADLDEGQQQALKQALAAIKITADSTKEAPGMKRLHRGCHSFTECLAIIQSATAGGFLPVDPNAARPDEVTVRKQMDKEAAVGLAQFAHFPCTRVKPDDIVEYSDQVENAAAFIRGGFITVAIDSKYLTKCSNSPTETGWCARLRAPVLVLNYSLTAPVKTAEPNTLKALFKKKAAEKAAATGAAVGGTTPAATTATNTAAGPAADSK